jgi:RimJ/RimL family protein N-acetyltransferase
LAKNYWEAKDIRLRAAEEKDLERYLSERSAPDSIRQWYEDELLFPESAEEIKKSFEEALIEFSKDDKRIFIIETLAGDYVGEIDVWYTKRKSGVFRYGIFLEECARGKGFGKQALVIVMDYYFNELNYRKASPTVYSFNKNSQLFHEKLGFTFEGKLVDDVYSRGKYHDMLYYALFKEKFNELYKHDFMN